MPSTPSTQTNGEILGTSIATLPVTGIGAFYLSQRTHSFISFLIFLILVAAFLWNLAGLIRLFINLKREKGEIELG